MKLLKSTLLLMAILCTVLSTQSCTDEWCEDDWCKDECDVVCQNGGVCEDNACFCPSGYVGTNCESIDIAQIQALLYDGVTPKTLYEGGVPLEQLYGKTYQDGLIFYLNTADGTGMVAATEDQSDGAKWGCEGTDIPNLANLTIYIVPDLETEMGVRIGDGKTNTDAILAGCMTDGIAAKLCRDKGVDWFLPSRGELTLMYKNLHEKGHGGFANSRYWISTECYETNAWNLNFNSFNWAILIKSNSFHVRAARAF